MKLGVLDYGAGNLRSVLNAIATTGHQASLVTEPEHFEALDLLVFPGQGAFGDSVRILKAQRLWEPLQTWLREGRPYLGFCLGYQLLFERSEECPGVRGLGFAAGDVRRFNKAAGLKIPHMGWNQVTVKDASHPCWKGLDNPAHFYFVHSYHPRVENEGLVFCETTYGEPFASGIAAPSLVAVQFHPEKSQANGLRLLENCIETLGSGVSSPAGQIA
jgi:imidazole glycerol phosphate synthase glutamine amidotransferase subunit